jgi:hypothetical protein
MGLKEKEGARLTESKKEVVELIQKKVTGLTANREGTGLIKNRGG